LTLRQHLASLWLRTALFVALRVQIGAIVFSVAVSEQCFCQEH
jgi:hypothetical protein